ncbi:11180_t:CDS:1, partial [Dentiscutata heterogama]
MTIKKEKTSHAEFMESNHKTYYILSDLRSYFKIRSFPTSYIG